MKKRQKITISYEGSDYSVEVMKLLKVISYLKDESIKDASEENIAKLLEELQLYDEVFLRNINKA